MATYEVYLGGPPTKNYGLSMFPAIPFDEAGAGFQVGPAAHKGPAAYNDKRLLDFTGGDYALSEMIRNTPPVQGDILGCVLIPKNTILFGFSYKVIKAKAGVTVTPRLRGKASTYVAINCATLNEGFYVASGTAVPAITEAVCSLALCWFDNKPDMLDLTLTALPASGLSGVSLELTPVFVTTSVGGTP